MPYTKRDPHSGAKIFIPTDFEKSTIAQARELKRQLEEVAELKAQLMEMVGKVKADKGAST